MSLRSKTYSSDYGVEERSAEGKRLAYYGKRKHTKASTRLKNKIRNCDKSDLLADAGVGAMLVGTSSVLMTAGEALFGCSPFACGAALVALYSCAGSFTFSNIPKAFVIGVAATSAAYVMSAFTSLPTQAVVAAAGFALYHYAR